MIDCRKIKDIREDKDITQEEMAKIIKVKRSTYSLWEIGRSIIPLEHLITFADYFNISIDYALGLTNDRNIIIIKGFNPKILGENLKICRKSYNLTQKKLEEKLGFKRSIICKYETNDCGISIENLYKYSIMFNKSLSELCGKNIDKDNLLLHI